LQITIINHCYIFSLDEEKPKEVASLESIDLLMDPKRMLNLGFKPQFALLQEDKDNRIDIKTIVMSPDGLMSYEIKQSLMEHDGESRGSRVVSQIYSPAVQTAYSQLNLIEVNRISCAVKKKRRIPDFSEATALCNYNGNTLISLFA
jgi:hypothetical protein